jgi:hypothetical protein
LFPVCVKIVAKELSLVQVFHWKHLFLCCSFFPFLFLLSLLFRFLVIPSIPPIFFFFFYSFSLFSHRLFSPFLYGHIPSLFPLSYIFILFFPSFSRLCNCQHFHTQVGSLTEVQVHSHILSPTCL